ncbi:unnamed protein product, partial [Rotaria magnacalcarata]
MWGSNAAAPLNAAHLGYGIGAVFVNLLVRPFLTQKSTLVNEKDYKQTNKTLSDVNLTPNSSSLFIPYSITALLCFLLAIGHLFFYIKE